MRLAVRHDLDLDVGALDERTIGILAAGGAAGRGRGGVAGREDDDDAPEDTEQLARFHAVYLSSIDERDLRILGRPRSRDSLVSRPCRNGAVTDSFLPSKPDVTVPGGAPPFDDPEAVQSPGISDSRTGRCSWSERVAASAIAERLDAVAGRARADGSSPRATRMNAANSSR